jgi:hypothetical protein
MLEAVGIYVCVAIDKHSLRTFLPYLEAKEKESSSGNWFSLSLVTLFTL